MKKAGLWHGPRRVEIEVVKTSMRRACTRCGDHPVQRRLYVVEGVGRAGRIETYCETCGDLWIVERAIEARRARKLLRTGEGTVRRGAASK